MNRFLYILFFIFTTLTIWGQNKKENHSHVFDLLIKSIKDSDQYLGQNNDSISSSSLLKTRDFTVSISENPIMFNISHIVAKNPYYNDNFNKSDDYLNIPSKNNYPISYSVIYENKLVSLFENGKFVCYNLVDLQRDTIFENKINTKEFKYHWIINNKLGALVENTIYVWNNNKWEKLTIEFPLQKQPKLFEDDNFIVFRDCHGEWGGTVYFFDKISNEIYFTESTCANSVFKKDEKYAVLAQLGHLMSSCEIKLIENPRKLTKVKKKEINKTKKGQALGYQDRSNVYEKTLCAPSF